MTGIERTIWYS